MNRALIRVVSRVRALRTLPPWVGAVALGLATLTTACIPQERQSAGCEPDSPPPSAPPAVYVPPPPVTPPPQNPAAPPAAPASPPPVAPPAGPPPPPAQPPPPAGPLREASVLLVIGNEDNPGEGDEELEQVLEDMGFDVDVQEDVDAALEDDGEDFGFILVVSSAAAGTLEDNFRNDRVPVLSMDSGLYEDMRMVDDEGGTEGQIQGQQISIVRDSHPLAAGLRGDITVAAELSAIQWGIPSAEAEIVATIPGDPTRATIFAYDAGDSMEGR